jgi:hypothetical protein
MEGHAVGLVVVRKIYAQRHVCPDCGGVDTRDGGDTPAGSFKYRICRTCDRSWKVVAVAHEVYDPAMPCADSWVIPADRHSRAGEGRMADCYAVV